MKVNEIESKVPSYLRSFNLGYEDIVLIFVKNPSVYLDSTSDKSETSLENSTLDEHETTGNPLHVDLGGSDDTILDVIQSEVVRNSWTPDECKHHPMPISNARDLISKYTYENPVSKLVTPPALAICDGQDRERTVVLGAGCAKVPMQLRVLSLGCKAREDAFKMVEDSIEKHVKHAPSKTVKNPEINKQVKIKYDIYGKSLKLLHVQDASMRTRDKHACISLDVACKNFVFTPTENEANLKLNLNLEIVVGHEILNLGHFWNDLCVLQNFLELSYDSKISSDEDTILCKNPWKYQTIFAKISMLATTNASRFSTQIAGLDLANLREGDILDNLWDILKHCENLYVLRMSINKFLVELADGGNTVTVPDNDFKIAIVVNKIANKNLLMTPINFAQALDFLFEMGVRKLKKDYQKILTFFYPGVESKIDSVFRSHFEKIKPHDGARRLDVSTEQLKYLAQLHIASEFIYLVRSQVNLFDESFHYFCKFVCSQYVKDTTKIADFLEVYQTPLQTLSIELFPKEIRMVQDLHPVRWTLEMFYVTTGNTEMTIVYDLSESPIFPPAIDTSELPVMDENSLGRRIYYVACMIRRLGFF